MSVEKNKIIVDVDTKSGKASVKDFNKELDKTGTTADTSGKSLLNYGNLIKGAAVTGAVLAVVGALKKVISAAAEQEVIFNRLGNQLKIAGESYTGASKAMVDDFLAGMQATTTYGDTDVAPVLGKLTQLTGDLQASMELSKLAFDMQASGMMDANAASLLLARAWEGDVAALGRYVPALKEASLKQMNFKDDSEKVAYAMEVLRSKFGGMAAGETDTLIGAVSQFKNEFGDFEEKVGDPFLGFLKDTVKIATGVVSNLNQFIDTIAGLTPEHIKALRESREAVEANQERLDFSWERYYAAETDHARKYWLDKIKGFMEGGIQLEEAVKNAEANVTNAEQEAGLKRLEQSKIFKESLEAAGLSDEQILKQLQKFYPAVYGPPEGLVVPAPPSAPEGLTAPLTELKIKLLSLTEPQKALEQSITLYKDKQEEVTEGSKEWLELEIQIVGAEQQLTGLLERQAAARESQTTLGQDVLDLSTAMYDEQQLLNELEEHRLNLERERTYELASQVDYYGGPLLDGITSVVDGVIDGQRAFEDFEHFAKEVGINFLKMGARLLINVGIEKIAGSIKKGQVTTQVALNTGLGIQIGEELAIVAALKTQLALRIAMKALSGGLFHQGGTVMHQGGFIPKAHSGLYNPDERWILAQTGEGVLNREATAAIGGKPGVDYLNKRKRLPRTGGFVNNGTINIITPNPEDFHKQLEEYTAAQETY